MLQLRFNVLKPNFPAERWKLNSGVWKVPRKMQGTDAGLGMDLESRELGC